MHNSVNALGASDLYSCCANSFRHVQLLGPHGLQPTRLLSRRNFPDKNTGLGCHFLLQNIEKTTTRHKVRNITNTQIKRRRLRRRTSATERNYPTSKVRGRSREDPMPEGWRPRGATPRPRSGAAAGRSYPQPNLRARPGAAVRR